MALSKAARERRRCERSCLRKVRFYHRYQAEKAAKVQNARGRHLRVYLCLFCGNYHLTSEPE